MEFLSKLMAWFEFIPINLAKYSKISYKRPKFHSEVPKIPNTLRKILNVHHIYVRFRRICTKTNGKILSFQSITFKKIFGQNSQFLIFNKNPNPIQIFFHSQSPIYEWILRYLHDSMYIHTWVINLQGFLFVIFDRWQGYEVISSQG